MNPSEDKQGLVIVRLDLCGALEMPGRFVKFPLGEAGAGIEVIGFKQIGIEGDRLIELCHRFRMSLAERQSEAE